jgi:hypothetical protein
MKVKGKGECPRADRCSSTLFKEGRSNLTVLY